MNSARIGLTWMPAASARLALGTALLALFIIYADTARSIVSLWNSSETYAHGYIIVPISLWLIWQRRQALAYITPAPYWPGLLLLAASGMAWLLAELGDVQVVRQYAFVAMVPLTALTILGAEMTRAMVFPLFFLLLAVPFGDIFVPPLIDFTADFTVAALQATGIPVLRNGTNFEIPSGSWSVVEACSGVRYLISSFTLGCLYAYLSYRSLTRRILFILLSIAVPILANGLRAYLIVMIGHLSDNKLAAGVDHLVYGWVFFGIVMFLMFWIGNYWREDKLQEVPQAVNQAVHEEPASASTQTATILAIACLAFWPWYANHVEQAAFNAKPAQLDSFSSRWQETSPFTDWQPGFVSANAELHRFFQSGKEQVGVSIRFYRNQRQGSTLIGSSNRLVHEKEKRWMQVGAEHRREHIGEHALEVREARIQGMSGPFLVWSWYWIGGKFLTSDYAGKLLQAQEKLMLRGDDGAALMVFAPYTINPEEARLAMRHFLAENMASLEATLAHNKNRALSR